MLGACNFSNRTSHWMRDGSGAVSYYDAHFGLVLDKLEAIGKAQDTVVLVTGVSTFCQARVVRG